MSICAFVCACLCASVRLCIFNDPHFKSKFSDKMTYKAKMNASLFLNVSVCAILCACACKNMYVYVCTLDKYI